MNVSTKGNGGTKRVNYRKRKQNIFFATIVALPILQFCICYIYVNINSIILAFQEYAVPDSGLGFEVTFAGISNFKEAIELISIRPHMFKHSFLLFLCTTIVGLTLALLFSYYIYKQYPMHGVFRVVLFIPKILSAVVFCLLYKYIVNDVYKYIVETILKAGPVQGILDNQDTKLAGLLFFSVWVSFGVSVLMFTGSMSGIDESIVESAQLDGANTIQEFFYISVPMVWPTFVSFLTIHIAGIFSDQMHVHTFYGNNGDEMSTFGYYLYVQANKANYISTDSSPSFSVLSAMGAMITAVMMPTILGIRKVLRKYGPSVD